MHRYFEFFFSAWSTFSFYKRSAPNETDFNFFLYICCNFGQIFCTNVSHFFSVENMGHNQLKKCSKYHLVSLLNEKQRSTFANFWHLFIHVTLLTHSAMIQANLNQWGGATFISSDDIFSSCILQENMYNYTWYVVMNIKIWGPIDTDFEIWTYIPWKLNIHIKIDISSQTRPHVATVLILWPRLVTPLFGYME